MNENCRRGFLQNQGLGFSAEEDEDETKIEVKENGDG